MRLFSWKLYTSAAVLLAAAGAYGVVATHDASASTQTLFGVAVEMRGGQTYAEALAQREASYGVPNMTRVFYTDNPGAWTDPKLGVDLPVNVSFKPDPSDVNSGSLDSFYRAWFKAAPKTRPLWWTYYHEPENNISQGDFTAAAFRTAWQRIYNISQESGVAKSNVKSALVLMDYTLDPASGRNWSDYYPGAKYVDVMSWDVYSFHEKDSAAGNNETMADHQVRRPSLAVTKAAGKSYAISELGYDDPTTRPAFLRDAATWARDNGAVWVSYFDNTKGTTGDHSLLDAPSQAAWRDVMSGALWAGAPVITTKAGPAAATASTVQWTSQVDPRGQTWYVACASWTAAANSFVEDAASARHAVSGNPAAVACKRTGLPSGTAVTVRVKLYDASGALQYRGDQLVIDTAS